MNIAIDGISMSNPQPGGFKTYTTNLIKHLQPIDSANNYRLLVDRSIPWQPTPNWQVELISRRGSLGFIWREQVALPRYAQKYNVNLFHSPAATAPLLASIPQVVTILDTIEFSEPLPKHIRPWAMRMYSRFALQRAAQRARRIITISKYAKQCIVSRFTLSPEFVTVIYLAPSFRFQPQQRENTVDQVESKFAAPGYILAIASTAKRKNSSAVLKAYARLSPALRAQHKLLFVCTHAQAKAAVVAQADQLDLSSSVVFAEKVSDVDLVLLYNAASVFVFPSLEEGFGLPPLEAMACGTPVIASNTSSLPEVLGDAAVLVSPVEIQELVDAMESVLTDISLADELRQRGLARSRLFSWDKTARATLAVYESALAE